MPKIEIWVPVIGDGTEENPYRADVPREVEYTTDEGCPQDLETGRPLNAHFNCIVDVEDLARCEHRVPDAQVAFADRQRVRMIRHVRVNAYVVRPNEPIPSEADGWTRHATRAGTVYCRPSPASNIVLVEEGDVREAERTGTLPQLGPGGEAARAEKVLANMEGAHTPSGKRLAVELLELAGKVHKLPASQRLAVAQRRGLLDVEIEEPSPAQPQPRGRAR